MPSKIKTAIHSLKYFGLSFLLILLALIGFLVFISIPILITVAFSIKTEKYFNEIIGKSIGWLIGLLTAGILFSAVNYFLYPYWKRLNNYAKTFKKYPHADKVG